MDDIIAIKIVDKEQGEGAFLTRGRIFDAVNEEKIVKTIAQHCEKWRIRTPLSYKLCYSLADVSDYLLFFEGFFFFTQEKIPSTKTLYTSWLKKQKSLLKKGEQIYFLGFKKWERIEQHDIAESKSGNIMHLRKDKSLVYGAYFKT